jgi:transposase-like protein
MQWTKEVKEELIKLYDEGMKYAQIAEHFDVSPKAVSVVLSNLRKQGKVSTRNHPWTQEQINEVIFLKNADFTIKEIQETITLNRSYDAVESVICKHFPKFKQCSREFSEVELLDLVREYKTTTKYNEARKSGLDIPGIQEFKNVFGSWTHAKELAGLDASRTGGLVIGEPTTVYLVKFIEENFVKLGITQRTIERRLAAYPKFEILFQETMEYKKALAKELEWKRKLQANKYHPKDPVFRIIGGFSECYKLSDHG